MLLKGQIYSKYWNNPIFRLKNNPTPNSSQFLIRQDIGNNCLQSNFSTIVVKLFHISGLTHYKFPDLLKSIYL